MKIGFNKYSYPEQRCIINKVEGCDYVYLPKSKLIKIAQLLEHKILNKNISNYSFRHIRFSNKKINGYHFFNDVTDMNIPYITTFETFLPRINELSNAHHSKNSELKIHKYSDVERHLNLIAKKNCKKIIALSQCNYNIQKELLKLYPGMGNDILNKMVQIHPPQEMLITNYEEKKISNDIIRFVFIGGDFVRKGGVEIVKAFHDIMNMYNFPIELVLITNLDNTYNYAFKDFQDKEDELESIKEIINNSSWIKHYQKLSNDKVIEIIKYSHVGLLPTWADTYGYSVLEFQAAGCPVITTNVRALCEINNNECGWVIEVPTNKFGEMAIENINEKNKLRNDIIKELKNIIKNICDNKELIKNKALYSMKRIEECHCPKKYDILLKDIYNNAFDK